MKDEHCPDKVAAISLDDNVYILSQLSVSFK